MRELKFRGWATSGSVGCFVYFDVREDNDFDFHEFYSSCEADNIEQYTGLKDKNGKEIYEGDIVTLNGEWEEIEHGDCSIVTFENGCFRVGNGYENEAGNYLSDWRIIGNIHENPELCGDDNEED